MIRRLTIVPAVLLIAVLSAPPGARAQDPLSTAEAVDRAIVHVSVITDGGGRPVRGSGSGILIEPDGLILTANHVVSRARQIEVRLWTGETYPARLIGSDPLFDAALIKIDPREGLASAAFGSSALLQRGQLLTALGRSPRRQQGPTSGAFVELDLEARPGVPYLRALATVWPGDSGGALLNERGEVIGLIVAITRDGSVSLSVAIDAIRSFLPELRLGLVRHAWLGITGTTISERLVQDLGLAVRSGVLIFEVMPGGPAALAGLRGGVAGDPRELPRGGDIIISIDGRAVSSFGTLAAYVLSRRIGEAVTLEIMRGGQVFLTVVVLGERPGI